MIFQSLVKVFRGVLALILTFLVGVEVYIIGLSINSLYSGGPQNAFEWGALVGLLAFFAIIYFVGFFIWINKLKKNSFKTVSSRIQLLAIAIFSVGPAVLYLADTLLRRVFLIEQPFTESLLKALVYLIFLPFD